MALQNCINYLLTVAQHQVHQTFSSALEPFHITPGQYGVLGCLWERGPCTPKEIAQILQLENSTVSGVLDRMQKRGLIDRVIDPADRRSIRVVPTQEGLALKEGVLEVIDQLNAQLLADFPQEQRALFLDLLRQVGQVALPEE